ncbi:MAG: TolC family protein [Rhodocyclaceae bacterium]
MAEQLDAERQLVAASEVLFKLSDARYRNGVDSYPGLLDAQRSLYAAQQELIGVRLSSGQPGDALQGDAVVAGSNPPGLPGMMTAGRR